MTKETKQIKAIEEILSDPYSGLEFPLSNDELEVEVEVEVEDDDGIAPISSD